MQPKDKKSASTNTLWEPVQKQTEGYLGAVGRVFNAGNKLPQINAQQKWGMDQTRALAKQDVPGLDQAQNYVTGLLGSGGMTAGMQQATDYLNPFASGEYQEDPRLLATIGRERNNATNAAATRFGGGRYGAAGMGTGMGQAQTAATDGLMLQSNENARNRQMQAAQAIGALGQGGASNALTAGSMISGLNDLRYDGASRMAGVGDFYNNFKQQQLQNYGAAISPFLTAGASQISTSPGPTAAQSILGGGLVGGKVGSAFGPWGTLAGVVGGGVLGGWG